MEYQVTQVQEQGMHIQSQVLQLKQSLGSRAGREEQASQQEQLRQQDERTMQLLGGLQDSIETLNSRLEQFDIDMDFKVTQA